MNRILLMVSIFLFSTGIGHSQSELQNWMHTSPSDGFVGVAADRTYQELLKDRKGRNVIVAVIDSGVDIEHEDLYQNIWTNIDEIPDNGIDDDKNGYVDDVHGWNFIGGPNGENVDGETLEITRLYAYYREKFKDVNPIKLSDEEKKEYAKYLSFEKEINKEREIAQASLDKLAPISSTVLQSFEAISPFINSEYYNQTTIDTIASMDQMVVIGKSILNQILNDEGSDSLNFNKTVELVQEELLSEEKRYKTKLDYQYNPDFDSRKEIVKDNYEDSDEMYYGNNDVEGPDARHGTHVAGIIAAMRDNEVGMNGIGDNVLIMSIRTVPDGDERDKDVANAIRYAVDNGASIINMSFGKSYAWDKDVVDDAVKYADKNDVLLIHAAGNDGKDNDTNDNFPNDKFAKTGFFLCPKKESKAWIEVGALSHIQENGNNVASFSNYGKEKVDLFAPGTAIYSTVPNDRYEYLQGTSMAAPVVAGVAAVIRSYFPTLKAEQVKEILLSTTTPLDIEVKQPGSGEMVPFSDLSVSGGVVNLFNAVKKAMGTKGKKKIKQQEPERV